MKRKFTKSAKRPVIRKGAIKIINWIEVSPKQEKAEKLNLDKRNKLFKARLKSFLNAGYKLGKETKYTQELILV